MNRVGQYEMVSRDQTREFKGRTLRIILYGAYNTLGLIGPEDNGIAIIDETNKRMILDGHQKEETGCFGPSKKQLEEFVKIILMNEDELEKLIENHPRRM